MYTDFMPARNVIKAYIADGIYHVYNRGINKSPLFIDRKDYRVFLTILKSYLIPRDKGKLLTIFANTELPDSVRKQAAKSLRIANYNDTISLITYCLMPNHYHLLIKQKNKYDMKEFMRSLSNRYTIYFNTRYKRRSTLFEGTYKAVYVETDEQLIHVSRYIHRNPVGLEKTLLNTGNKIYDQPSSYPVYLRNINKEWVKSDIILAHFSPSGYNSYQSFVEDASYGMEERAAYTLKNIGIDNQ